MPDFPDLRVQLRVLPILGPGKIELLDAIDRHGSISFKEPVVVRTMGGRRGDHRRLSIHMGVN